MLRRFMIAIGTVEAAMLVFWLLRYMADPPGSAGSGGPQMALFFFILLPMAPLSLALLLLLFGRKSRVAIGLATLIVMTPVLGLAAWGVNEVQISLNEGRLRSGRGYFTGAPAQALGEAIVRRDGPAVTRLAAQTDVNAPGRYGITFLKLALANSQFDIGIVQRLLAAGANANDDEAWALRVAIAHRSVPLLMALLTAGADPNALDASGAPVFFEAIREPELIPPLLGGGARLAATNDAGRSILLQAIHDQCWDAAQTLLDLGADPGAVDRDGKNARMLLVEIRTRTEAEARPMGPKLLALEAKLQHLQQ